MKTTIVLPALLPLVEHQLMSGQRLAPIRVSLRPSDETADVPLVDQSSAVDDTVVGRDCAVSVSDDRVRITIVLPSRQFCSRYSFGQFWSYQNDNPVARLRPLPPVSTLLSPQG